MSAAKGNGSTPPKSEFPVVWVDEAELPKAQPPILKGLIEPGAFVVIYGPSGSGKSFFTADIAQHVATGAQWRGRRTNKALVVYVAAEAGTSILKRFIAWRENRLSEAHDAVPLAIVTRGPNLLASVPKEQLYMQLAALAEQAQLPLGLVIFDTLSRSIHGGDENKAEDMTLVIEAADVIREKFNAATLFVHHSGKDATKGARGHSALLAAADLVLFIDNHTATVEKVRDGVANERFPFALQIVEIGEDADGDVMTTCLVNEVEASATTQNNGKGLGKNQKPILDALRLLVGEAGKASLGTSAIPKGVLVASFQTLCERMEPKYPALKPWQVKKKVGEALTGLEGSGYAGLHGDSVWLR